MASDEACQQRRKLQAHRKDVQTLFLSFWRYFWNLQSVFWICAPTSDLAGISPCRLRPMFKQNRHKARWNHVPPWKFCHLEKLNWCSQIAKRNEPRPHCSWLVHTENEHSTQDKFLLQECSGLVCMTLWWSLCRSFHETNSAQGKRRWRLVSCWFCQISAFLSEFCIFLILGEDSEPKRAIPGSADHNCSTEHQKPLQNALTHENCKQRQDSYCKSWWIHNLDSK